MFPTRNSALNIASALGLVLLLAACGNPEAAKQNAIMTPAETTSTTAKMQAEAMNATAPAAKGTEDEFAGDEVNDPIEGFNRAMFQFNYGVDRVILRPTVWVYKTVMPEFARTGISSLLDNWYEPVNFANALLQGKFQVAANSFWRFVINSSLGFFGFADVATEAGLQKQKEDFGQTLGTWGVGSGPYLVLPIIGPSSVRDGAGMLADVGLDPSTYLMTERDLWWRAGVKGFDARYRSDRLIEDIYQSVDPYATMRSLYTQRRAALVAE